MKLEAEAVVKEYYESVRHNYPDISFEEFKKICYAPFEFTRKQMENDRLPVIRLKYFGTFMVYPKRAKGLLKDLGKKKVKDKEFFRIRDMLESFLEKHGENNT